MSASRVVLLGSRGFVGSNLLKALQSVDFEVVCVTSSDANLSTPMGATALSGFVRDGDTVVNSAAIVPARNTSDVIENLNIVEAIATGLTGVELEQFLVISSDAVYGDVSGTITAKSPINADSYYSGMCVMREIAACEISAKSIAIIRPTAIYGFGDSHNSYGPNRFIRTGLQEREIKIFGQGKASRDHVHISDVCKAVVHAITSRANGTFNIASGSAISFHDVARIVRDAIGDDVSIESVGAESEPTHRHCDAADMRSWFPEFDPTTIESGIGAVVDQYRR